MVVRVLLLVSPLFIASCSSSDGVPPAPDPHFPHGGLYATIAVDTETFHLNVTHPDGMAQARAVWSGSSNANIPVGNLVCTAVDWNRPWTWHLEPESVRFAETTIELCDGRPSYVEAHCPTFAEGQYCPWSAQMTQLRDCSTDPRCPPVPR